MKQLNYPNDFTPELCDLLSFTSHLTDKFGDAPVRVFINRVRYKADKNHQTMKYVNIDFQVFEQGSESRLGTHYTWESHRSIGVGCAQSNIKQLTQEEVRAVEIEFLSARISAFTAEELASSKTACALMIELINRRKELED